jgi:DNA polymerase-3 subunit delta
MIHVLHGDDDYSARQALDQLKAALGDPTTADLNTTVLEGRSLTFDELRTTCDTMPFLSERRLVVVEGLLARYEPRAGIADGGKPRSDTLESSLRAYLPGVPDTADLVFAERVALSERNTLLKVIKQSGGTVREFPSPAGADLSAWIIQRVRSSGARMSPRAAETLAAFVGGNLRQLAQEIEKLATYANGRQIEDADVHLLVADAREVKVWTLTDAVAARNRDGAVAALRQMLDEGEQPLMLLAMITRQFRSLIMVKELAEGGASADKIAGQLRMNPYIARKSADTARSFSFERLETIYRHLLDTDVAVKTGRAEPALALDLLVIELTSASAARR